jgi:hypothetical protein
MSAEIKWDFSYLYENNHEVFNDPIHLSGEVMHGFKRGNCPFRC